MISVIIPVYNAEKTIEKCVESIEVNSYKDVEIILVEDCSKDNSWEICKKLAEKYTNIKCVRNERNRGVSYTRNHGLKLAVGEYIMFVDSDDWVDENYFSEFLQIFESTENALVICGYVNHDEKVNGTTDIFGWNDFEGVKKYNIKDVIKSLHERSLLQQLWNKIFITELIKEKGIYFDESISIGEDTRFVLEYIRKCQIETIYLLNKPLYHYIRGQTGSLMYKVGYESVEEPLKNLRMLYQILGLEANKIDVIIRDERQKQIELYAYLIFHNKGMDEQEKKRLILNLDEKQGASLYKKNRKLFYKERVVVLLKKLVGQEK